MLDIQSKIESAIYQNDLLRIKELVKTESPDFNTVTFAVNRTRKFSNTRTRETLLLVLSYACGLSIEQKSQVKELGEYAPTQVKNILNLF